MVQTARLQRLPAAQSMSQRTGNTQTKPVITKNTAWMIQCSFTTVSDKASTAAT